MATCNKFCGVTLACALVFALFAAEASSENTKTVEFNVKPGGVVHTFSEGIVSDCIQYYLYFTPTANVCKHHPDTQL